MNMRRNAVAHLTASSLSRVLGQLPSRLDAPRMTRALRLFSQGAPAMPRPTLANDFERLVPSLTSQASLPQSNTPLSLSIATWSRRRRTSRFVA